MKTTTATVLRAISMSRSDKMYFGEEPTWHLTPIAPASYNSQILRGLHWHRTATNASHWRMFFEQWIKHQNHRDAASHLANLAAMPDAELYGTACILARMVMQGFALSEGHQHLVDHFYATVQSYQKRSAAPKTVTAPTASGVSVFDRSKEFVRPLLSDIDFLADELFEKREQFAHTIFTALKDRPYKIPHYNIIAAHLKRYVDEWQAALDGADADLVEGYRCHRPRTIKRAVAVFEDLLLVVEEKRTAAKPKRVVKKKPLDKNKMVAKVRYCTADASLNIKSIHPVDIIGSTVLWVYDTQKRKLGMFEAEEKGGLYIKGTTVYGFKATCAKTMRKPSVQLPEFARLRKTQLMHWMNGIRAKCGEMNGRLNTHMLLLRAD